MKVCIAEKPSVAREIAQIIGAKIKRDGYFEGNGYQVTYTFGHFCTLYQPDDYKLTWKRWDLDNLPMLPERFETKLISNPGVKKQFGIIKKLVTNAEMVINCGDAGQEGELIQRWVLKEAKYTGKVERLWISSLTKEAIKEGFKNLKPASDYDNLYYAGSSRAIGDWLLGMNATRLYTLKYGGYKQVLSIGRVQTPTLAILVKRHHEIESFKPQKYWELQTHYRDTAFNYEKGKFKKQEEGMALLEKIKDKPFKIISVEKKKGKEYAPKLFDLTGLQVYCNKRFGYTAENTLKLVQKLYEQKLVTYPRVDTTYLPTDVYPKIKGTLAKLKNYSEFTKPLLSAPIKKTKRVFDDKKITDHHAIIPTGMERPLPQYEQNVYDAITRRFIAAFYPECIVSKTNVIGAVEEIQFKSSGKEILEPAWRVLYPRKKTDENEDKILPNFKVDESGFHKPSFLEKETTPPKHYTEATLLRAMETAGKQVEDEELRDLMKENGIGRPSTRANIIETLFKRKYIKRKRKNLIPTEMGIELIDTIENKLLTSAELTGIWEKQLRDISLGKYKAQQFIFNMKKMVDDLVLEVRLSNKKRRFSNPATAKKRTVKKTTPKSTNKKLVGQSCPKCKKGKLIKGKTAFGCSNWKTGCNFKLPFVFANKKISENQLMRLLSKGSTVNLKGFESNGKKIEALIHFDNDFNMVLAPKQNTEKQKSANNLTQDKISCPKCKTGTVIRGKTAYGCSRWKQGCDFRFNYSDIKKLAQGKKLTKDLVLEIINKK